MSVPRVFISYAHESPEHDAAIQALAGWLLERGVEAITDQPHENRPPETGWNTWMLHKAAQRNDKFFPILPDGGHREHIPTRVRRLTVP